MNTLRVELGERSYPIYIGAGLLGRADLLKPDIAGKQVMKKLAIALTASTDWLLLEEGERGPDDELKLQVRGGPPV